MIYDISPTIRESIAVWPGDTRPSREILMEISRGDTVTLSTLHATVHLGAHADAPSHYHRDGQSIDERDPGIYLGRCQVASVSVEKNGLIWSGHLREPIAAPRLLVRTNTFTDPDRFQTDFAALTPEFVAHCADHGVKLIGIDTPSVDPFPSKTLDAHKTFLHHDMAILEGLVLRDVPDGFYELIALPLKLHGFDASPVRAILRTFDDPSRSPG